MGWFFKGYLTLKRKGLKRRKLEWRAVGWLSELLLHRQTEESFRSALRLEYRFGWLVWDITLSQERAEKGELTYWLGSMLVTKII